MLVRGVPIRDAEGAVERWFGTVTDIDDGHRLSEDRELLANELAHRIKNIFAVITGLISLRARGDEKLLAFGDDLNATIQALSRAQGFVHPLSGAGAELLGLLKEMMAPYSYNDGASVSITGDPVCFGAKSATPLALVFHELATNATKYGALSRDTGRVEINVTQADKDVVITWRETGGPQVSPPDKAGFGSRLISRAIKNQMSGKLDQTWDKNGLIVTISLPLELIAK
jgi:two-component sensor histidine kinase